MGVTKQTPELLDYICEKISEGVTLADICREKNIGRTIVYEWMKDDPSFAERFARARDAGFDVIADDCLKIADDGTNDFAKTNLGSEDSPIQIETFNSEHVQRSKLRIETRLKLLAKWNPKKYGDKLDVTSDGEKIQTQAIEIIVVPPNDSDS